MFEAFVALVIFVCLAGAALLSLALQQKLPARYRKSDTHEIVRVVASIFVVMSSLVLGLMINSARNTFESIERNIHGFATDLIVLDRMLRQYGPEANETRTRLAAYVERAAHSPHENDPIKSDRTSESLLDASGSALKALKAPDAAHAAILQGAQRQFEKIVQDRWVLIVQSEGGVPPPLIVTLVAWLVLIFASFGYRAPNNAVVVSSFLLAALLLACAIYLIMDMEVPFSGPIQISTAPLDRVIAEMRR